MSFYTVELSDDYMAETLVRLSDGQEIASLCADSPEDNTFGRDASPVVEELNRLAARIAQLETDLGDLANRAYVQTVVGDAINNASLCHECEPRLDRQIQEAVAEAEAELEAG